MQLAKDGVVIRLHPIRHDQSRELGPFAHPKAGPGQDQHRMIMAPTYRTPSVAWIPEIDNG
jgi:hypothetical protein